jgi:hypothetical protein
MTDGHDIQQVVFEYFSKDIYKWSSVGDESHFATKTVSFSG